MRDMGDDDDDALEIQRGSLDGVQCVDKVTYTLTREETHAYGRRLGLNLEQLMEEAGVFVVRHYHLHDTPPHPPPQRLHPGTRYVIHVDASLCRDAIRDWQQRARQRHRHTRRERERVD